MLTMLWPSEAGATGLSGKLRLDNQNILVIGSKKYHGQFDLRYKFPVGDDFVLTKVVVNFKFQDDKEWVSKSGNSSLENTGKIVRHNGFSLRKKNVVGQTDHYYAAKSTVYLSNVEEVAKLTIGSNRYYSTTIRRRDVTQEILGEKKINLGTYRDTGDNHRMRQHYRITESIVESHRDGYDGLFEIRRKELDLATIQDLAHSGILKFELGGQGDYIFDEATIQYEGHIAGLEITERPQGGLFNGSIWLALLSLPMGWGFIWWKKRKIIVATRKQKRIAQRKVPKQRAF